MLKTHLIFSLLVISSVCEAQTVFSFKGLPKDSIDAIEKKFISAFDSRENFACAFPKKEKEVKEHWIVLQQTFSEYLKENNFLLADDLRIFLRFYFDKNGAIDYVGYNLHMPLPKENVFVNHLTQFSNSYRFGMEAKQPYAQCGTVTFKKRE